MSKTRKSHSKKQKRVKRRGTFKRSKIPPRRKDIVKGGSYGASAFPASINAQSRFYAEDPNRFGMSVSNQPDMVRGLNPALKGGKSHRKSRRHGHQKGGGFQQSYLNSVSSMSQLASAGVINHPPMLTDAIGVSAFGTGIMSGPQVYTLTNTNPPLA